MGGRGSSSGVSVQGKRYGSEYSSLLTYGNIKFVVVNNGNTKAPKETMTNNRVYVTLDRVTGEPKYISYYDKSNKKEKQIDLQHGHAGMMPHIHHGYEHNENDSPKGASKLTVKEKKLASLISDVWRERRDYAWAQWKARNSNNNG
ncbi:hypothetical protein [Schwartzia succinivorans]|jgi:hypothetical protein|uniref:Uncharacterized protein n=1 Tax=Schwartzia succinivorans DSM 10502 TaxID=1123243 RepID=A0A1M4Y768_9FIRM|nr:hypothetical protein [Schwartzia succinivorans]SHF01302.1 hypothetical protein SAMN02745190_01645 [Schwartzia succinivorans DSM 10502]